MPPIAVESETPVLDRTKLAALKELIGEDKCAAAMQRFNGELIACLAAIEANAPDSAEHAHNLAGVADLLGFNDLANESRRYIAAVHRGKEDVGPFSRSLLQAGRWAERELART
jgi:hypothetical protein